jgi:hypothetical protein
MRIIGCLLLILGLVVICATQDDSLLQEGRRKGAAASEAKPERKNIASPLHAGEIVGTITLVPGRFYRLPHTFYANPPGGQPSPPPVPYPEKDYTPRLQLSPSRD